MRNTRYFQLNVFDEAVAKATGLSHDSEEVRGLATERWNRSAAKHNEALYTLFQRFGCGEFKANKGIFNVGKYWQMLDYLDGNHLLGEYRDPRNSIAGGRAGRMHFQDRLITETALTDDREVLQVGWDLAINSALLSHSMREPREHAVQYILDHVVWDRDSLMYPSVTNQFQRRVVNESLWEGLADTRPSGTLFALDQLLTQNAGELDADVAERCLNRAARRKVNPHTGVVDFGVLVDGDTGIESFQGLSPRALRNYGEFLGRLLNRGGELRKMLAPYVTMYKKAVSCKDEDGNTYFDKPERAEMIGLVQC